MIAVLAAPMSSVDEVMTMAISSVRLPNFDPQEDMSAEQAANLLEAVENLEREQRRAQAEEERRQRARTATEKDW